MPLAAAALRVVAARGRGSEAAVPAAPMPVALAAVEGSAASAPVAEANIAWKSWPSALVPRRWQVLVPEGSTSCWICWMRLITSA